MANRILLGNHGTYGYGLFVSKPGVDVTGASKLTNIFDSTSDRMGQILIFQELDVATTGTTFVFNNFNCNVFGYVFSGSDKETIQIATIAANQSYVGVSVVKTNSTTSTATFTNSHTSAVSCIFIAIKEDL